jgi:Kef-type K+ transport system membrane component KefB
VPHISPELAYVALLFALFVVPRALQRFGLPAAITSLLLGAAAGMGLGLFQHDTTIHLLSAFGIVALFLFAGLDVDTQELQGNAGILIQHLAVGAALLFAVAYLIVEFLHLDPRAATLLALALLTPSTGFILDSIENLGLAPPEKRWIKAKAIATELLALLVLFGTLQSTTFERMAVSSLLLVGMIILLPVVFRAFAALVVPFAPRSEFAFLLMIAVLAAFLTRELGVYYLVGAFVVGMAAQRFRKRIPAIASEQLIHAVEMFASFFVPFYFFSAGLQLRREDLSVAALAYGGSFLAVMVPVRIAAVALHRRVSLREKLGAGGRIAVAMLPTLVFGLVIAEILRDRFVVSPPIFGGLIFYTLVTTIVPVFFFNRRPPVYDEPHAPELAVAVEACQSPEGTSTARVPIFTQQRGERADGETPEQG